MTFENAAVLTRPWTLHYVYHRGDRDAQLWEYACQVNAPGWSERFAGDPEFKGKPEEIAFGLSPEGAARAAG